MKNIAAVVTSWVLLSALVLMGMDDPFFPLVVIFALAALVVLALLLVATKVGPKSFNAAKAEPFESGNPPRGDARMRFSIKFYLVAMLFLIFDLEGAFILSYAVSCETLGWSGWLQISFFIVMLMGEPRVLPKRTPDVISASSCSISMRLPRP